jgi:hypothetical protein
MGSESGGVPTTGGVSFLNPVFPHLGRQTKLPSFDVSLMLTQLLCNGRSPSSLIVLINGRNGADWRMQLGADWVDLHDTGYDLSDAAKPPLTPAGWGSMRDTGGVGQPTVSTNSDPSVTEKVRR